MQLTPQVKSSLLTAVFTAILVFLITLLYNHLYPPIDTSKQTPFTVEGTGTATAKPDLAQVSLTITKTAPTLQDAQNQANTASNTVVADIKKLGISSTDIKTNNYNSYPNYNNNSNAQPVFLPPNTNNQTITSYTVSQQIDIQIKDAQKVNTVIDTATKDNAENISGPNYVFSDSLQKSLEDQARTQAINNAKQKAQSIAKAAGINLGKITNIQENNTPGIIRPVMMMNKAAPVASGTSVPTNINPGENTVTDDVTLSYQTY